MANYNNLKTAIKDVIKLNGNQEITGEILQNALISMINSLGAGYQFIGVATPETNPSIPDQKVFYVANGKGTYANFGGLIVDEDEVIILYYDTDWHKLLTGIASQTKLTELVSLTNFLAKKEKQKNLSPEFISDHYYTATGVIIEWPGYGYTKPIKLEPNEEIILNLGEIFYTGVDVSSISQVSQNGDFIRSIYNTKGYKYLSYVNTSSAIIYISVCGLIEQLPYIIAKLSEAASFQDVLTGWILSESFTIKSTNRDEDSYLVSADIVWPDGTNGKITPTYDDNNLITKIDIIYDTASYSLNIIRDENGFSTKTELVKN